MLLGLTQNEVQERIARSQTNYIEKFTTRTITSILCNNIFTLFNGVLTIAVIALILVRANVDALFLSTVTCVNVLVSLFEELRAKVILDRLTLLYRRTVKVVRDQTEQLISIEEVVKDDVVAITSGEQIIADGRLISSQPIYVDESLVTGEADTIKKITSERLLSGTLCTSGSGYYQAVRVGKDAYINVITAQAKHYKVVHTPMQKDIDRLVEGLTIIMIVFIVLLSATALVQKLPLAHSVLAIVTVIKSLVPQGLVLISTMSFALGAIRAAKKQVLVQKLHAIEAMSHLTTLCLDKTGTIGTNKLNFERLELLSSSSEEVTHKLKLFVGAISDKNKTIQTIEEKFTGIKSELIAELPFVSAHKMSAVQLNHENVEYSLWLGAPEILTANQLNAAETKKLAELRRQGFRVLLFASSLGSIVAKLKLTNLAFVVLRDELRPNLVEAIKFYENREVTLKILSGDHPETIAALANQAGITQSGELINGQNLIGLSKSEFNRAVNQGQFFGCLVPQQKQQIIKTLQMGKEFVGMIGDGINDVLALKQADIGIAMNSGAAAAKDVADITLLQDSFAYLPFLSQEGDRIIYNIKRIAKLFITKNVYCLLYMILAMIIGLKFPLSPRYITWIDMLTIGIPITILTLTTPNLPKQSVRHFFADTIKFALAAGAIVASFAVLIYAYSFLWQHHGPMYSKTIGMSVIIAMGLYIMFFATVKAKQTSAVKSQRYLVWGIIIFSILLFFFGMHWQLMRNLLDVASLDMAAWKAIVMVSVIGILILRMVLKLRFLSSTEMHAIAK
jgi:cation-transporting P-type ATPase E